MPVNLLGPVWYGVAFGSMPFAPGRDRHGVQPAETRRAGTRRQCQDEVVPTGLARRGYRLTVRGLGVGLQKREIGLATEPVDTVR